ncbi:MAG: hypothetical protein MI750_09685, partial [Xanthomonadales bacterium]|nr:hypothetical protein [Xanthomonadales bacterium]
LSTLSVQIDGNDIYELQSEITIERVNGDTLVQMTTMSSDTLCNFVDEIFADGFEAPVAQSPFTSS